MSTTEAVLRLMHDPNPIFRETLCRFVNMPQSEIPALLDRMRAARAKVESEGRPGAEAACLCVLEG